MLIYPKLNINEKGGAKVKAKIYQDRLRKKLKDPKFKKGYEKELRKVNELLKKAEKKP